MLHKLAGFCEYTKASKQPEKLRSPLISTENKAGNFKSTFLKASGDLTKERRDVRVAGAPPLCLCQEVSCFSSANKPTLLHDMYIK